MHSSWGSGCLIAAASCPTPFSHTLLIFCLVPLLVPLGAGVFAYVALLPLIYSGLTLGTDAALASLRTFCYSAFIVSPALSFCCVALRPLALGSVRRGRWCSDRTSRNVKRTRYITYCRGKSEAAVDNQSSSARLPNNCAFLVPATRSAHVRRLRRWWGVVALSLVRRWWFH